MPGRAVSHAVRGLIVLAALAVAGPWVAQPAVGQTGTNYAVSVHAYEFVDPQPTCGSGGYERGTGETFTRKDCGWVDVLVTPSDETDPIEGLGTTLTITDADAQVVLESTAATDASGAVRFYVEPTADWAPGRFDVEAVLADPNSGSASTYLVLNPLHVDADAGGAYAPGDPVTVSGTVSEFDQVTCCAQTETPVGATVSARLLDADGNELAGPVETTASGLDGTFSVTFDPPGTAGLSAGAETGFRLGLQAVIDASYDDPTPIVPYDPDNAPMTSGAWSGQGRVPVTLATPPSGLLIETSFVSSLGWVKPGDPYPFRVTLRNYDTTEVTGGTVTVEAPSSGTPTPETDATITAATANQGGGAATVAGDGSSVTWSGFTVPAAADDGTPGLASLVLEATADDLTQDPQIVWKDLSATATVTYPGGPIDGVSSTSHGPKVIPPDEQFDTARYGDRPFPVVPVRFFDRAPQPGNRSDELSTVINDPTFPGSTFNLYQEMSYGQLYPHGTVPSAGITTAGWDYAGADGEGFVFTELAPQGTCNGATYKDLADTPVYPDRIVDGWYALPGDTQYYGTDKASAVSFGAAAAGIAPPDIDNACGPTGKSVYDAAQIADPEVDYNDYDTDKDGVVDFFMMIFVGCGGNGVSQEGAAACPYDVESYDNIWPHSSSLEFTYQDENGEKGYVSDDQLTDLEGHPLFWTDDTRTSRTTDDTGIPVYVRVGPYNVNPETVFDSASVISHEYGHSLGLPDFYSIDPNRQTYGSWNLMATDRSQNVDVFGKQELGWIVPQPVTAGSVTDWQDSKVDTGAIVWQQPDGTPYTLSDANGHPGIHNGLAFKATLPGRQLIDPATFDSGDTASADHAFWSGSGNDFGCPPQKGHNLDLYLPELANVAAGSTVTLDFKSLWDIEWDYDYGFVLVSDDNGETYTSLPSENGYTTDGTTNPNANGCQSTYGNGITGSSGSYQAGTQEVDRLPVTSAYPEPVFLADRYDLSSYAGQSIVLRFTYATDPGLARPGWFVDDIAVSVDGEPIYQTDAEAEGPGPDDHLFNGGCEEGMRVAATCTPGWKYISANAGSPADHAYYLEMRDRSGFDYDGHGQADRGPATFSPGLYLMYTDEAHGYGNVGTDDPPAQSPLDANPQPGNEDPDLDDAAFTSSGVTHFDDDPTGGDWVDNYQDPSSDDENWHFAYDCLGFDVTAMSGAGTGPSVVGDPGTLSGDVTFTTGSGCGSFDYGYAGQTVTDTAPTAVAQVSEANPATGQTITFDGSSSTDDQAITGYEWDFDYDGSTFTVDATGDQATHAYATAGTYTAALRVTDSGAQTDIDTVNVVVEDAPSNAPPTADAGADRTVRAGDAVTFDGGNSSDPDKGDTLSYAWSIDEDPARANPTSGTGVTFQTTFADAGTTYTRTVRLHVDDGNGGTDEDTLTVTVQPDGVPVARAGADPNPADVGQTVTFDGRASSDPDGDPLTYSWDFDDADGVGQDATGSTATHAYGAAGSFTATLTVTDDHGRSDTATIDVAVQDGSGGGTDGGSTDGGTSDAGDVVRLSGADRWRTAIDISQARFADGSAEVVVLARGDNGANNDGFADGLAGTPLAIHLGAPLLITAPDHLVSETETEIERVLGGSGEVVLLGGPIALAPAVRDRLDALGYATRRLAGADRIATALDIAEATNPDPAAIMIARAWAFPDALAAGPAAAAAGGVVVLNGDVERDPRVESYLDEHPDVPVYAIGGQMARLFPEATGVWGPDRFATAVDVAETFFDGPTVVGLARADTFPDSLAGGVHVGALGGPVLLTNAPDAETPGHLHPTPEGYVCDQHANLDDGYVFGGVQAVSTDTEAVFTDRLRGDGC